MEWKWNGKHVRFWHALYDKKIERPACFPQQIGIICRQKVMPLLSWSTVVDEGQQVEVTYAWTNVLLYTSKYTDQDQ